ncbi:hypothetical protein [Mudlarkpox virus]|nr:hypothetical protein [Mudlarkpox virus]
MYKHYFLYHWKHNSYDSRISWRVSVRSVFDAYHVKTQCMYPATCQGYGIYLRTVTSKLDKMVCEYAINRTKFEDTYASNDSHKHLSLPPSDGNNPSNKTNMDHNLVIWMAPVNITDWNRVYPPNDGCHNGPLPHLFYPTNNSEVNKFCLSYGIYPTTPIPYITE